MPRKNLEVADIFRAHGRGWRRANVGHVSLGQMKVMSAIESCRTVALGGHVAACEKCDHIHIAYNSCRNRHCPKCQAMARARWLAEREAELLPIAYFHIVFTMPAELAAVALQNKRQLYGMLFEAASETLKQVAANPRHLGAAQIGLLAVLHTWGQNLMHHPHLHCVVSGGGLSADSKHWIASCEYYFLPVRLLSYVFRQKYGRLLRQAFERGELNFYGQLAPLRQPQAFGEFLAATTGRDWVVFAKRPFHEPACVLKYLARYTHRVAISNGRLIAYRDGKVTFGYQDYARQGQRRTMTLAAGEFLRRFLMHVLPSGFMRIRHYGYLANRVRVKQLKNIRQKLAICSDSEAGTPEQSSAGAGLPTERCPKCKSGYLHFVGEIPSARQRRRDALSVSP